MIDVGIDHTKTSESETPCRSPPSICTCRCRLNSAVEILKQRSDSCASSARAAFR